MSAALSSSLCLYHLPLHPPSAVHFHCSGSFTRPKAQELVLVTSSSSLSLYRSDENTGVLSLISSTPLFAHVLAVTAFRSLAATLDYVLLTNDSGELLILAYDAASQRFIKIQRSVVGKTGMRRGVAGHYVAVEPKGRALMIAALEKMKMTYILNRDTEIMNAATAANNPTAALTALTVSSPLEAHKSNILTLSICALDVGYDNPIFVALEVDYTQADRSAIDIQRGQISKYLTYYELDLGLNHVTRKHSERIDSAAYLLLTVPGPTEGPGGILIICESYLIYHPYDPLFSLPRSHSPITPLLSQYSLRCYFPVRHGIDSNPNLLIISHTQYVGKSISFFLLQSEHGDLYKVTLKTAGANTDSKTMITNVVISYFDTIPPATGISILKTGFLFSASESSSHYLYRMIGLGDDDGKGEYIAADVSQTAEAQQGNLIYFHLHTTPVNLAEESTLDGLHPIMDMKVSDPTAINSPNLVVTDPTPIIYTLCGKGSRSSLRFLRHGLAMTELALSDMMNTPTAVFTVKTHADSNSPYHSYIIVSFGAVTVTLSIGEQVTEVSDSGLLDDVSSLYVSSMSDGSIIQVHANGMRHIKADKRIVEWKPPGKKQIMLACGNEKNVVICLSGGELIYFESDRQGTMIDLYRKDMMNDVAAVAIAPVEEGKMRGKWVVVSGYDNTVRVFSTDPTAPLQQMTLLAVNSQVSSLLVLQMSSEDADAENLAASSSSSSSSSITTSLYLYTGLVNGVLIRSHLDSATAALSEHRKRFLGPRALRLYRCQVQQKSAVLALSDRSWLDYSLSLSTSTAASSHHLLPLSYDALDAGAYFSSPQCPEGIVAIVGSTLRILAVEGVEKGEMFHSTRVPLRYTPRKMEIIPTSQYIAVIETDQNAYSKKERQELENIMKESQPEGQDGTNANNEDNHQMTDRETGDNANVSAGTIAEEEQRKIEELIGSPYAGEGKWASCISIHPPPYLNSPNATGTTNTNTPFIHEFEDNEAAFSLAIVQFEGSNTEYYLIVGTAKDLVYSPRTFTSGFLHTFLMDSNGTKLKHIHRTAVPEIPLAIASFQRRLLVGAGQSLRSYELGKKKLLCKNESGGFNATICNITIVPNSERIIVADLAQGFHFLQFSSLSRSFSIFSDSLLPRFITAACLLDSDSIAGADKFSNLFVCRLPSSLSAATLAKGGGIEGSVDVELATLANRYTRSSLASGSNNNIPASNKLQDLISFHVDSIITSMVKVKFQLAPSAPTFLLCATLSGALLVFLPLNNREEIELLTHLEMHIRAELPSLTGRDHLSWRSSYLPVRGVIDGQLIEQFTKLKREKQQKIAEEVVSSSAEVKKKLEDIRNRVL